MRSLRLAEWALSLVMPRERAASVVGDLAEDSRPFRVSFWLNLLRIWIGTVWRGVAADWERLLGRAALALLIQYALVTALVVVFAVAVGVFALLLWGRDGPPAWALATLPRWAGAAGYGAMIFAQVKVGGWLGRRCPGREIAACLVLKLVEAGAVNAIASLTGLANSGPAPDYAWTLGWVPSLALSLPLFYGAARVRRQL